MRERIIEYHINRLKDKNPQVRLKAIEELRLLEAIEALDALREVYETDAHDDIRQSAKEAGRVLFISKRKQEANPGT
jgi:HEAT repeat protein